MKQIRNVIPILYMLRIAGRLLSSRARKSNAQKRYIHKPLKQSQRH